jgi:hypothetical protein
VINDGVVLSDAVAVINNSVLLGDGWGSNSKLMTICGMSVSRSVLDSCNVMLKTGAITNGVSRCMLNSSNRVSDVERSERWGYVTSTCSVCFNHSRVVRLLCDESSAAVMDGSILDNSGVSWLHVCVVMHSSKVMAIADVVTGQTSVRIFLVHINLDMGDTVQR